MASGGSRGAILLLALLPAGCGEAAGHSVPGNAQGQALAGGAFRRRLAVGGIVGALRLTDGDLEPLSHSAEKQVEGLHAG